MFFGLIGIVVLGGLASLFFLILYIRLNDKHINHIPERVLAFSPTRTTPQDVIDTAARLSASPPISMKDQLPPRTGRRYIVVGGGGFLGGWITASLLDRGEDPKRIRLLDLNPPNNYYVKDSLSRGTQFIKVDVTDSISLNAAFQAPWDDTTTPGGPEPEVTVFHTVANIRFYERTLAFVSRSARVNITGTENILKAARSVGANILIYTSSGSVGVWSQRFWLWPWEKEPQRYVQVINDDDSNLPKHHDDFFSNYAVTKIQAEFLVRSADKSPSGDKILRTGCLRPGNGIFGPRGDMLCGAYLVRGTNPTWISNIVQSFTYVENGALAHLCYEQRLLELNAGSKNPDIGGQAFCIADPGPLCSFGDVYTTLETLSEGECHFPKLPATAMLLLAYTIEFYYTRRQALIDAGWDIAKRLPSVDGDLVNLQPSLFFLTQTHLIFDDSRARLSPEKGGLGYRGAWTTIEGLHKTFEEFKSGIGRSDSRSSTAGVSFGFKPKVSKAQKAVANIDDKITEKIGVSPVEVLSMK